MRRADAYEIRKSDLIGRDCCRCAISFLSAFCSATSRSRSVGSWEGFLFPPSPAGLGQL